MLGILLCASLTACMSENDRNDNYNYDSVSPLDMCLVASRRNENENENGLQVVPTFSNEFGVAFLFRNETENRLYYNDDFRLDSLEMSERNNPAGLQFINNGDTKQAHVSWGLTSRPTGIYTFERDFFLDEDLTELYTTLVFDFALIGWYHFTEDATPIPTNLQELRDKHERERLAFQIAGGSSTIIVLASEVAVSRTEVAFNTTNLSTQSFMHGLNYSLLVYDDGWKHVPTITDALDIPAIGITIQGGEVIEDRFIFEWLHGELANGRYMIMRPHDEDHMRPGAPRVREMLMVEFIIDDNTPQVLESNIEL